MYKAGLAPSLAQRRRRGPAGASGKGGAQAEGEGLLRGSPELLTRRGELLLRALTSLAVEERERSLKQMRQTLQSYEEELPVTQASHCTHRYT